MQGYPVDVRCFKGGMDRQTLSLFFIAAGAFSVLVGLFLLSADNDYPWWRFALAFGAIGVGVLMRVGAQR